MIIILCRVNAAEGFLFWSHCWFSELLSRRSWRSCGGNRGWKLCHLGEDFLCGHSELPVNGKLYASNPDTSGTEEVPILVQCPF